MTPETLADLLTDLGSAAALVDAIEDARLQRQRGWDLAGWRYELVPWGVRFRRPGGLDFGEVVVTLATHPIARQAPSAAKVLLAR